MQTSSHIAERLIKATDKDGRELTLVLRLGIPYKVTEDEWACSVCIEGLHHKLRDIHGVDSWQTLLLAMKLVSQLLGYFIEEGGRLYWFGTDDEMSLSDLF